MAKARLLQAVCTVAMLATAPAFAQTDTQPGRPGTGNTMNSPEPDNGSMAGSPTQSNRMSSGNAMSGQSMHRSAMAGHSRMMGGKSDTSQNATVDQLNEQSYRAAQQGQAFSASNMSPNGSMAPAGSGSRMAPATSSSGATPPGSDAAALQNDDTRR
jgi:hypothetical protein